MKEEVRITLRLPKELHEKLIASSGAIDRPLNTEIIKRLENSFFAESEDDAIATIGDIKRIVREELIRK